MTERTIEELLVAYATGPDRLEQAVAGMQGDQFDAALGPEEWSVRLIIHHLADGDDVWARVIRLALGAPGSALALGEYPGNEEWANRMRWSELPVEPSLALFRANRAIVATLLDCRPDGCHEVARFADQALKVSRILASVEEHLQEHLAQIREIRQMRGA